MLIGVGLFALWMKQRSAKNSGLFVALISVFFVIVSYLVFVAEKI